RDRASIQKRRLRQKISREEETVRGIARDADRDSSLRQRAARALPGHVVAPGAAGQSLPTWKAPASTGTSPARPCADRLPPRSARRSSASCIASGVAKPFHCP